MTKLTENTERRNQTGHLINSMLKDSKHLLAMLLEVSAIQHENTTKRDRKLLDDFCQALVDYIAAGHFGLFQRVTDGKERRKKVADFVVKIYSKIEQSTQISLGINERYRSSKNKIDLSNLQQDFSQLAEHITLRMDLEDQLIKQLMSI